MTPRSRSSRHRNADKDMGKAWFHQEGPDTYELTVGSISIIEGLWFVG